MRLAEGPEVLKKKKSECGLTMVFEITGGHPEGLDEFKQWSPDLRVWYVIHFISSANIFRNKSRDLLKQESRSSVA